MTIYERWDIKRTKKLAGPVRNPDEVKLAKMLSGENPYLLVVVPEHNKATHRLGRATFTATERSNELDEIPLAEIEQLTVNKRAELRAAAYELTKRNLQAAVPEYCHAETNQWAEMVSEAKIAKAADDELKDSGDWSYFDGMIPEVDGAPLMTSREYGLEVLVKYGVLKTTFDSEMAKRNLHKKLIAEASYAELLNYNVV